MKNLIIKLKKYSIIFSLFFGKFLYGFIGFVLLIITYRLMSFFIAGYWEKFILAYRIKNSNNFFKDYFLWLNFSLNWHYWLFADEVIVNSEIKVEYVGNCKYISDSLQ